MIQEDYVSFETAKLLKEKGFEQKTDYATSWYANQYYKNSCQGEWFEGEHQIIEDIDDLCNVSYLSDMGIFIPAPTLQMAMKWLREVHNLVIEPYRTACGYLYTISSIPYGSTKYDNSQAFNGDDEDSGQWSTWEKACEDGIKYCLENLI